MFSGLSFILERCVRECAMAKRAKGGGGDGGGGGSSSAITHNNDDILPVEVSDLIDFKHP